MWSVSHTIVCDLVMPKLYMAIVYSSNTERNVSFSNLRTLIKLFSHQIVSLTSHNAISVDVT